MVIHTTFFIFLLVFYLALITFVVIAHWKLYSKASQPGWAVLVPIYNLIVLCDIAKQPRWYTIMMFLPIVNIVFYIFMMSGLSKQFGKDNGFTVGLVFLSFIFIPILAFGNARYQGARVDGRSDILDHEYTN
jgi:hypothetical protein